MSNGTKCCIFMIILLVLGAVIGYYYWDYVKDASERVRKQARYI
jgi:hypothetical protein